MIDLKRFKNLILEKMGEIVPPTRRPLMFLSPNKIMQKILKPKFVLSIIDRCEQAEEAVIDLTAECETLQARELELQKELKLARHKIQGLEGNMSSISKTGESLRVLLMEKIARLERKIVPDGYQPVPIEPTMEMIAALGFNGDVDLAIGHALISKELSDTYKNMLLTVHTHMDVMAHNKIKSQVKTILRKIAKWHGEFPAVNDRNGNPSSFGLEHGSNGERDYMRNRAEEALQLLDEVEASNECFAAIETLKNLNYSYIGGNLWQLTEEEKPNIEEIVFSTPFMVSHIKEIFNGWVGDELRNHLNRGESTSDTKRAANIALLAFLNIIKDAEINHGGKLIDNAPVKGDLLPQIGETVLINLASQNEWVKHTVAGYYVWGSLGEDKNLHRVFIRVRDEDGNLNARLLSDIKRDEI